MVEVTTPDPLIVTSTGDAVEKAPPARFTAWRSALRAGDRGHRGRCGTRCPPPRPQAITCRRSSPG